MGRQKKITDTFVESKAEAREKIKLPVKRKLIPSGDENSDNFESCIPSAGCSTSIAAPVGLEDVFQTAKKALHTSVPLSLPGRDTQIDEVYNWLNHHLTEKQGGAMYISGAPGTGKTAVVQHSTRMYEDALTSEKATRKNTTEKKQNFYKLFINCMSIVNPSKIYDDIWSSVKASKELKGESTKDKLRKRFIKSSKSTKMMLLVLDEMDQLLQGKGNEVLYSLFEWARVPGSKLILIGIANALDLTVRHLPLLGISAKISQNSSISRADTSSVLKKKNDKSFTAESISSVHVINFPPYEKADIEAILEHRLMEIGSQIFDPQAIRFVAVKVASSTGDMRKALNSCKVALDAVEKQQRLVLKTTADDGFNFSSPKKLCMLQGKIGVSVVNSIFGPKKDDGPLPLQQMVVLGALLKIYKTAPNSRYPKVDGVATAIPVTVAYEEYRKICSVKGFSWIDRSEILSVCGMLQDRSLVTVIENTAGPSSKKFGGLHSKNKTGIMFDPKAVEKILAQGAMKYITEM